MRISVWTVLSGPNHGCLAGWLRGLAQRSNGCSWLLQIHSSSPSGWQETGDQDGAGRSFRAVGSLKPERGALHWADTGLACCTRAGIPQQSELRQGPGAGTAPPADWVYYILQALGAKICIGLRSYPLSSAQRVWVSQTIESYSLQKQLAFHLWTTCPTFQIFLAVFIAHNGVGTPSLT
jgi:hypothetical protein